MTSQSCCRCRCRPRGDPLTADDYRFVSTRAREPFPTQPVTSRVGGGGSPSVHSACGGSELRVQRDVDRTIEELNRLNVDGLAKFLSHIDVHFPFRFPS